jgi:hypothetical protein
MKRLLNGLKALTLAVILTASAIPVAAQSYEGCNDFVHGNDQFGRHWDCFIDGADDEWCYYTCYSFQ